jgi:hypothetical protein
MPYIAPVGWRLDADTETIVMSGRDFAATKRFRDVAHTGRAAMVIDDVLPAVAASRVGGPRPCRRDQRSRAAHGDHAGPES